MTVKLSDDITKSSAVDGSISSPLTQITKALVDCGMPYSSQPVLKSKARASPVLCRYSLLVHIQPDGAISEKIGLIAGLALLLSAIVRTSRGFGTLQLLLPEKLELFSSLHRVKASSQVYCSDDGDFSHTRLVLLSIIISSSAVKLCSMHLCSAAHS